MVEIMRYALPTILILLSIPRFALATVQVLDRGWYEGSSCVFLDRPLEYLWKDWPQRPHFDEESTGNRKGYTAVWEIRESKLYLVSFKATSHTNGVKIGWFVLIPRVTKNIGIDLVIPGVKLPVQASWYTGKLHVGIGEWAGTPLNPKYQRLVVLEIEKGIVVRSSEKRHAGKDGT